MTNRLTEILEKLWANVDSKRSISEVEQAQAAILQWVRDEVIGRDQHKWIEATPSQQTVAESLNELRAEQRKRLEQ